MNNKANYVSVTVQQSDLDDPTRLAEACDRAFDCANGYMLVGATAELDAYLREGKRKMDLILAIERIRTARVKEHPTTFFLVPWSVGYQCFVNKPDGFSIKVRAVNDDTAD